MTKKIKKQPKYTRADYPTNWTGIPRSRMRPYRKFVNRELPGFCGTYTASALTHYAILADRGAELEMASLIKAFRPVIDERPFYKGTYPWDVVRGLNKLLAEDGVYKARWHLISDPIVTEQLMQENPLPVIVGTAQALGNPYGNHWVLVYAFGYNNDGKLFYRVYDNHGKTQAVVPASQTLAAVWLERKNLTKERWENERI